MESTEAERYKLGEKQADFYAQALRAGQRRVASLSTAADYLRPEDMPWEDSRQGKLKHLANAGLESTISSINAYIQEIPPGSHSGKHRHYAEEFIYVIEGSGYDMHWDPQPAITPERFEWPLPAEGEAGQRWEWQAGDSILVPPMVVHQHFNADPERPVRLLCATSRAYEVTGFGGIEQIEDAPGSV